MLRAAVHRIEKRLGGLRAKEALEAIELSDFHKVADITLEYYDKAYNYGLSTRESKTVFEIKQDKIEPNKNAKEIIMFYNTLIQNNIL